MTGIERREASDVRAATPAGERPACEVTIRGEDAVNNASDICLKAGAPD